MVQKITYGGILGYLERLIPISGNLPGIKLGLSNLVIVTALYAFGDRTGFLILLLKIIITGFLFTNLSMMSYSLFGGVFSYLIMIILKKINLFSLVGVSMSGGVFHNIGQLFAFYLVAGNQFVFRYLSVLIITGLISGLITGFMTKSLLNRLNLLKITNKINF